MNKRGGTPITILALVLLTLSVFLAASLQLSNQETAVHKTISDISLIEKAYAKEIAMNRYLQDAINHAARTTSTEQPLEFIERDASRAAKEYLEQFQTVIPELAFAYAQLEDTSVKLVDNELVLTLDLKVEEKVTVTDEEITKVEYFYTKTFSAPLDVSEPIVAAT